MSKKMCPNPTNEPKKVLNNCGSTGSMARVKWFDLPVYKELKNSSHVEFYAYNPLLDALCRKRIKLNRIKRKTERRKYAKELIKRLIAKLSSGWSPFISDNDCDMEYMADALEQYEQHCDKMLSNGYYRKETYAGYKSNIRILREYIKRHNRIVYVYQFDKKFCGAFLDYIFIDRNNGAQTRNNYLNFLRVLGGYFVEKGKIASRPTDGIRPISKRLYKKEREAIPSDIVKKISAWLYDHDRHFLLACNILYYCYIRPIEMTRLRIGDFSVKNGTITIGAEKSKNRKKQIVAVPDKVMRLALELGVLSKPGNLFLFSDGMMPGTTPTSTKVMRDHWGKVRTALRLDKKYQFYSLKDTGLTEMCDRNIPTKSVRDQARHSSIAITELYLHHNESASPQFRKYEGSL